MRKYFLAIVFFAIFTPLHIFAAEKQTGISDLDICKTVANYANNGALSNLIVKSKKISIEEAENIFPEWRSYFYPSIRLWEVDINKDGITEIIAETSGQQVSNHVFIKSKKTSNSSRHIVGEKRELEMSIIKIKNNYYLIGIAWKESLTYLWSVSNDNKFNKICSFKQSDVPKITLVSGADQKVCSCDALDNIRYIDFSYEHKINKLPEESRFWAKDILPGLAVADIDNDGINENIAKIRFLPGNGQQCDTVFLAILCENKSTIPENENNEALFSMKACVPTRPPYSINIFEYEGKTYIDAKGWVGERDIYNLSKGKLENTCKFRSAVINEVIE